MAKPNVKGVRHVALYAPVPDPLDEFYETALGLQIVAQSNQNAESVRIAVTPALNIDD